MVRAHGVRGELIVEPLAPPESFTAGRRLMISRGEYEIAQARGGGRFLHVKLASVDTREQAQAFRGAYLQVREGDLAALPSPGKGRTGGAQEEGGRRGDTPS